MKIQIESFSRRNGIVVGKLKYYFSSELQAKMFLSGEWPLQNDEISLYKERIKDKIFGDNE